MVLRHQSPFRKPMRTFSLLAVSWWRRTLRGPDVFPVSLCEETTRTPSRSFENSKSGPEEEPRGASKNILWGHPVDMMARPNPNKLVRFLLNPNAKHPFTMPVLSRGGRNEGDDLVPDARLSPSFKTTAPPFCQSNRAFRGAPRRNSASLFSPLRRRGERSPHIARKRREEFPSQCRTTPHLSPGFPQFPIFSGACSFPPIRADGTVLFEPPYSQSPSKNLSVAAKKFSCFPHRNFSRSQLKEGLNPSRRSWRLFEFFPCSGPRAGDEVGERMWCMLWWDFPPQVAWQCVFKFPGALVPVWPPLSPFRCPRKVNSPAHGYSPCLLSDPRETPFPRPFTSAPFGGEGGSVRGRKFLEVSFENSHPYDVSAVFVLFLL
ncbi:hypothetical protein GWK47_006244 [Chionoecetes opilio]|uniref:Uncharacterized protein n=1 Tax=Chionoecetes opilio TaxID=41210 RepID=A0A8J5CWL9_CHIOP|nr:hypothetical protein GWK47_006244 [Chionoecetes opilio]